MATVYRKRGSWYLAFLDGQGRRRQLRTRARTRSEAKGLAYELERSAERQRLGLEPLPSECKLTFAELCEWWLKNRCSVKRADRERHRLKRHVFDSKIGGMPVPQITTGVIEDLLRGMERQGLQPATVNGLRGTLHTVFSRARKSRIWTGPNPISDVERRRNPQKIRATLAAEEISLLLLHIPDDWRDLFAAAIYTGMRKGELFGLRRQDVDLRERLIVVRRSYDSDTTKGKHADVLPIASALLPYLEHALERSTSEFVFPGPNGKMRTEEADPQKVLRHAMGRAGLVDGYEHICRRCKAAARLPCAERHPDATLRTCRTCGMKLWPRSISRAMRFHDLRHSAATLLLRAGVDLHRVQRILRHRDVKLTTGTYAHLLVEDLRAAVEALPASTEPQKSSSFTTRLLPFEGQSPKAKAAALQNHPGNRGLERVGETGFEPATPWSRTKCSTRLSHSPIAIGFN